MDPLNASDLSSNQSDFHSVFTRQVLPPLYFLVGVFGLALNGAAAGIFFRVPSDSGLVVYLKNMVVADLLMSATYPFRLAAELELGGWHLRVAMCRYLAVLFYLSMYVGIVFMGLISLDRYVKVVRHGSAPFPSSAGGLCRRLQGVGVARLLALFTWTFQLLCVLPNMLLTSLPADRQSSRDCMQLKTPLGKQWHIVSNSISVALFWLTLLLLTFCYASIARHIYRSSRRLQLQQGSVASRRSSRSIASLVLVFTLCFVPYHVTRAPYTLSQLQAVEFSRDTKFLLFQLKETTLFLSALNVCLDPIVYFLMCRHFRDSLLRKLSGRRSLNTAQSLSNL